MCLFANGVLVAYTGQPIPERKSIIDLTEPTIKPAFAGGDRRPAHLEDSKYTESYTGHRTNGKGGWISRNRGKKPEYKDRRLRANGSGKTRLKHTEF